MKRLLKLLVVALMAHTPALAETTLDQYRAIVVSPKASAVVRNAAGDLQYYLQQIAGREFPIVESASEEGLHFFVGPGLLSDQDAAIAALPPEGWMIRSIPNGLLLAGNDKGPFERFIFYHAVPLFLDKYCSVKWLWPGTSGEVIPQNPQLKIPDIDETGAPALERRKIDFYTARHWTPEVQEQFHRWQRNSLQGDQIRASFAHAWAGLFNEKDYEKHPEWFSQVDGKRLKPTKEAMNWQLCLSNAEMRDEFYKRLTRRISGNNVVSISPNDGGGFCECDECKARGSLGDLYWEFAADMATRLKKDHPENGIGTFAYTFFREPPEKIEKLPDNIWISMTTYSMGHVHPNRKAEFLGFLDKWKSKGVRLIMREYWGVHYWQDLPFLYPHEIAEGIQIATTAGLAGVYGEGSKNWSTQAPNYYVLTRTMWNPKADTDEILNEFYSCFGPAEKPVRAYFGVLQDAVHQRWKKDDPGIGWASVAPLLAQIFTPELMAKASAHLDEAESLAGDDKALRERIDFLRIGCDYTAHLGRLFNVYNKLGDVGRFRLEPQPELSFTERKALLEQAWELGQQRIELFNAARMTFAIDDGQYFHYISPDSSWNHHGQVAGMLRKQKEDWVQLISNEKEKK